MKKKNIKQSKMTLDKLALMMGQGFNEVHDKFDKIDEKFNKIDKRFNGIDEKIDILDNKIDNVEKKFDGKFNDLLNGQDEILKRLEDLEQENTMDIVFRERTENSISRLEKRVDLLEKKKT